MVSAVAVSVTMSGAPVAAKSSPTRTAARRSSAPTTTRSGWRLSWTADPSRRNSGLETTVMSARPVTRSTRVAVPTGTVDLLTTTAPGTRSGAISSAACSTARRSADPSSACGVGTHRKTKAAPRTASAAEATNRSDPASTPWRTSVASPFSTIGRLAPLEGLEALGVALGAHHPVAEVGQGGRRGQPHVARADHGHGSPAAGRHGASRPGGAHPTPAGSRRAPTSRPRPSCQSGRSGRSEQPQGGVVEHRVGRARGRPGRVEVGRGARPAPARGRGPPRPARPARSRTRWSRPGWSRGTCPGAGRRPGWRPPPPGRP